MLGFVHCTPIHSNVLPNSKNCEMLGFVHCTLIHSNVLPNSKNCEIMWNVGICTLYTHTLLLEKSANMTRTVCGQFINQWNGSSVQNQKMAKSDAMFECQTMWQSGRGQVTGVDYMAILTCSVPLWNPCSFIIVQPIVAQLKRKCWSLWNASIIYCVKNENKNVEPKKFSYWWRHLDSVWYFLGSFSTSFCDPPALSTSTNRTNSDNKPKESGRVQYQFSKNKQNYQNFHATNNAPVI